MKRPILLLIIIILIFGGCNKDTIYIKDFSYITKEDKEEARSKLSKHLGEGLEFRNIERTSLLGSKLSEDMLLMLSDVKKGKIPTPKYLTKENFIDLWMNGELYLEEITYEESIDIFLEDREGMRLYRLIYY